MATGENPYEAPRAALRPAVGVKGGKREHLRGVAVAQRGTLVCLLVYFVLAGFNVTYVNNTPGVSVALRMALLGALLVDLIVGLVFVVSLSRRVYSTGLTVLFAFLAFIPCVNMLVLLALNSKATKILRDNGYRVGFFGVSPSEMPRD